MIEQTLSDLLLSPYSLGDTLAALDRIRAHVNPSGKHKRAFDSFAAQRAAIERLDSSLQRSLFATRRDIAAAAGLTYAALTAVLDDAATITDIDALLVPDASVSPSDAAYNRWRATSAAFSRALLRIEGLSWDAYSVKYADSIAKRAADLVIGRSAEELSDRRVAPPQQNIVQVNQTNVGATVKSLLGVSQGKSFERTASASLSLSAPSVEASLPSPSAVDVEPLPAVDVAAVRAAGRAAGRRQVK